MTQTTDAKIRIVSGFMSALDKCPECGDEHDVAQQVECRACGYHAGSDLSQEWMDHCEEELKDLPAGVTLDFAHDTEGGDSDYYFDFSVSPEADSAAVLAFFDRIAGGTTSAVRIGHEDVDLSARVLRIVRTGVFEAYSGAPIDFSRWNVVSAEELAAIKTEIDETPNPNATDWSRSAWECDYERVRRAVAAQQSGATVWTAQDEDGYYFAVENAA